MAAWTARLVVGALALCLTAATGWPVLAGPAAFRDVATRYPFETRTRSWDVDAGDLTGDGIDDLVMSYHGSVVFYGVAPVRVLFRVGGDDPHACTIADVDLEGHGDVYCTRGAATGTIAKRNRLWIRRREGGWVDRARRFGVADRYGRGRHTAFFDLNGDPYPDLFVANEFPRRDRHLSVNRSYVNQGGEGFREVRVGATESVGGLCVRTGDLDGDGWEDVVVCGQERLALYRNRWDRTGGRALHDVAPALGLDLRGVVSAGLVDLDRSDAEELVVLRPDVLLVFRLAADGVARAFRLPLVGGRWVTWGDLDGRAGLDLFVVRGCVGGRNRRDLALLDRGPRRGYATGSFVPAAGGCGDVATTIDLDLDGRDEVVVLNGAMGSPPNGGIAGPVQVLTRRAGT